MGESYLLSRKASLLAKTDESNPNLSKTIEEIANITQALGSSSASTGDGGTIDVTALAREATLFDIKNRLPALSSGTIPVSQPSFIVTPHWEDLTANTTIPEGSVYVYLTVTAGTVTINGLTKTEGEYLNLESCLPARHPAITIVIPNGAEVEVIRGY